jgi:hypothetical protein
LEATVKSLRGDNQNLEALLVQASRGGDAEVDERLDRLVQQLRQSKDALKLETEGRAMAESREVVLMEKVGQCILIKL